MQSLFMRCDQVCKPGSVSDNYLSVAVYCYTAQADFSCIAEQALRTVNRCSGWGLHEESVSLSSVRSYRTFSQSGL